MSGSTAGNPDHTFSKTSQPETAPGKQTLHSLEIKEGGKSKSQKAEWSRVQPERRYFLTWFRFFDLKKKKKKQTAQTFTKETHRGRRWASRVDCGGQWPHRWCWEPPDWAPSSRKCLSSPCGGSRCATCAPYVASRQRGRGGRCGNSFSIVTCLKEKEGE